MSELKVALGEYDTGWQVPSLSLQRAEAVIRAAGQSGADLVVLPEMCLTGFTMDPVTQAEALDAAGPQAIAALARDNRIHVVAGLALKTEGGRYVNAAVLFDRDGRLSAEYHKQHLFQYAGESLNYSAGSGPCVATINGLRTGFLICFDLRFPEAFRAIASAVDAVLLLANWPSTRHDHWNVLLRARAIENQCYVIGVNRTGEGGGLSYRGGSVAIGPWGEQLATSVPGAGPATATLSGDEVSAVRRRYPFLEA